ncbi:SAM-dependent methyltransferase [Chelatococcus asaccharovorans]|uniref:tRNA (Cmo5U34)-methyltransferase n=1 Tax=Chelatococcus asaccharovorans TaxID=28210 RepID=A0A2V3U5Q8_9HYPH|nr:class I SAM-dependent methyltransferase [Chelatococcus asaccharovorans]MBS7702937.1 class I SAM-dependent methyltransferase [Chelatococcus asaccharovorans]PXW57236.1 tRNA (cmo5U34)-methyltransferase [Chelatococcus asaccharovorans]
MSSPDTVAAAAKFDPERAAEYERQSRIALAGYEACHELAACMLAASLGSGRACRILVVGIGGTAQEVVAAAELEPDWRFVGVDPSPPMLALAQARLEERGLAARVDLNLGTVEELAGHELFDAATLVGVLHHLPGDDAKRAILRAIASRLAPGAPLILAGNHYAYADKPLLLKAWGERWRMFGADAAEVEAKRGKILQGADPPPSEEAVFALLDAAGFTDPQRFFASLFWGAWIARKR